MKHPGTSRRPIIKEIHEAMKTCHFQLTTMPEGMASMGSYTK